MVMFSKQGMAVNLVSVSDLKVNGDTMIFVSCFVPKEKVKGVQPVSSHAGVLKSWRVKKWNGYQKCLF